MKTSKLVIRIQKPVSEVFEFVTNPVNTPKWIDFIVTEKTNESPPKLGTIYHNQDRSGVWRDLEMTEFKENRMFVLTSRAIGYNVRYALKPVDGATELEYYEWMDQGDLDEPFTIRYLEKLKSLLEKDNL